jgi:hypothetical protein
MTMMTRICARAGAAALLLTTGLVFSGPCFAAGTASPPSRQASPLDGLAGKAVPEAQLDTLRAGGVLIVSSVSKGVVSGDTVGANSATGSISDNQSINNNTGFTNVFQNTGNNSLFQSSTTISITVR